MKIPTLGFLSSPYIAHDASCVMLNIDWTPLTINPVFGSKQLMFSNACDRATIMCIFCIAIVFSTDVLIQELFLLICD